MALSRFGGARAGFRTGASVSALAVAMGVAACTPTPAPSNQPDYVLCNSAGCGDNVDIVIDKDK